MTKKTGLRKASLYSPYSIHFFLLMIGAAMLYPFYIYVFLYQLATRLLLSKDKLNSSR